MTQDAPLTLAEQLAAAHDWWREAGVDSDFVDAPRDWLAKPATRAAAPEKAAVPSKPATPVVPPLGGDRASWPATLEEFGAWWLGNPDLETGGSGPRVAPRGAAGAELMVLVPMPEEGDNDRLLSGPQGRLVGNMLGAMGVAGNAAYIASALPRHVLHPDWQAVADRKLGAVLAHHIALAAPRRVLVLGRVLLPLFGHDPAQDGASARQIALQGCSAPALVSYGPETLLQTARFRGKLWRSWLDWTGEAE